MSDFTFRFATTGAFISVGVFDTFFFKFEIVLFINLEFPFFGMELMREEESDGEGVDRIREEGWEECFIIDINIRLKILGDIKEFVSIDGLNIVKRQIIINDIDDSIFENGEFYFKS